jgi:hypothetical protein
MKHLLIFEANKIEYSIGDITFYNHTNITGPKFGRQYKILKIYSGNSELQLIRTDQLNKYYVNVEDIRTGKIYNGWYAKNFQRGKLLYKNRPSNYDLDFNN